MDTAKDYFSNVRTYKIDEYKKKLKKPVVFCTKFTLKK